MAEINRETVSSYRATLEYFIVGKDSFNLLCFSIIWRDKLKRKVFAPENNFNFPSFVSKFLHKLQNWVFAAVSIRISQETNLRSYKLLSHFNAKNLNSQKV